MQTRLASLPAAFNNIFLTLALCVVSLGASHPSYAEYQLLDRIVAIADDDAVLASHVRDKMQQIKSVLARRGAAVPPDSVLYEQVLERAIIDSLQLQRAYKAGMRVSDQELNEAMERIAAQNRMSLQQFREALEQSGQSYVAAREQTREEILMRRIQQRSVMRKMSITQSEVDNFLASEQGQKLLQPEFNIDHILLPLPASASAAVRERARQQLLQINQRVGSAGFDIAQAQIAAAGAQHSPLGWRSKKNVPSLFEKTVAELLPGQASPVIESDSGLHIIKILEQRCGIAEASNETLVRHILVTPNEIRSEAEARELIFSIKAQLEQGTEFAALAKKHSDDPGSALAGGELGWSQPGQMVPAFEAVMDITDVGQTSEPFASTFGWHI
ncbi:MAG: molecular chaperone SurA, partial [Pseudomonadales bacterium]|nr:molecular chaperone SurA [Pseudomonadales bacterium]